MIPLPSFLQLPFRSATPLAPRQEEASSSMSDSRMSSGMGSSNSKPTSEAGSAAVVEQDNQLLQSIQDLRALSDQFHNRCRNPLCNRIFDIHDPDRIEKWREGARTIPPTSQLSAFICACKLVGCVGCNLTPTLNAKDLFSPLGIVNHCCDQGRLYTIYFLLARFDESQVQSEKPVKLQTKAKKKSPSKASKGSSSSGVGYASGYGTVYGGPWAGITVDEMDEMDDDEMMVPPHYTSYAAAYQSYTVGLRNIPLTDDDERSKKDALMIETLQLLGPCLPGTSSPAIVEKNLFRLTFLFDAIAELIRNDSITDVTERATLYTEVIRFIKLVADTPSLSDLLFEERQEKSQSPGLKRLANPMFPELAFPISYSSSASVFAGSKNIYEQVKIYLKLAAKKTLGGGSAQNPINPFNKETMRLCEGILELYEILKTRSNIDLSVSGNLNTSSSEAAAWAAFQTENRVTFTDEVLNAHRFTGEATTLKTSVVKNRLNTISKEVATLTTSLPPGILLKIAESRSDMMKVLIVGSEGSPYAGGLFTFDLFLPAEYPLTPPKMAFVLNGNDTDAYSFNPNLHVGGTVCLSILNTWSGMPQEMWQPNKSTLLAVLVSIQAMILGAPNPWHNEPGHENDGQSLQVKQNKMVVQSKTLRHAMIAWIENLWEDPRAKEHIWKEVSQTYWKYNRSQVLSEVVTWVPENPNLLNFSTSLPYPFGPKKGRGKQQSQVPPVNLVNRLAVSLGLPIPFDDSDDDEPEEKKKRGLLSRLKGKRKVSESDMNVAHHPKKQKSESAGSGETSELGQKWVYTGVHNQKESRAACKDFGIGAAASIKDTIKKLEKHVNEKGKANPAMLHKWGKWETATPPSFWDGSGFSPSEELPDHMTIAPWAE